MISLLIRLFSPSQLEREWIESTAFLLGERSWQSRDPELLAWQQVWQVWQVQCRRLLLCVSIPWSPTGIPIDFETDLSGYREKQVSPQYCKFHLTLTCFSIVSTCQNSQKNHFQETINWGENVSQAFYFGRQGKKVVPTYRASCLFYPIQLHKNLINEILLNSFYVWV